jgi:hypothetical protein
MFLLVGPQTSAIPGLFSAGQRGLAEILEWSLVGFRSAWREIEKLGLARADWTNRVVWIPNAIQHNPPESPNVVRSWRTTLADIPECALKVEAVQALRAFCGGLGEGFGKAFAEAYPEPCGKASPNQDQDQEQEQDLLRTLFEAFWEAYPRKEDRQAAWTQWQLMRPDAPFAAQIVAGVRRHLNTRAWRENLKKGNVQFIPLPSTFLSKGRWLDDVREEPAVKDDFPDWTAWHCPTCGEIHEGTQAQRRANWCPKQPGATPTDTERCH